MAETAAVEPSGARWRDPRVRRHLLIGLIADASFIVFVAFTGYLGFGLLYGGIALLPGLIAAAGPRTTTQGVADLVSVWAASLTLSTLALMVGSLMSSSGYFGAALVLALVMFMGIGVLAIVSAIGVFQLVRRMITSRADSSR